MASPSLSSDRLRTGEFSVIFFAMRGAGKKEILAGKCATARAPLPSNQEEKGKSLIVK